MLNGLRRRDTIVIFSADGGQALVIVTRAAFKRCTLSPDGETATMFLHSQQRSRAEEDQICFVVHPYNAHVIDKVQVWTFQQS